MTLAVGAGVLTGAGVLASPASADGVAPTGSYELNTTSIWAAQSVQLTQTALTDDVDPAGSIVRVVTWGDGSSETVPADTTKLRHKYAKVGTFTVSVALTDTEGNTAPGTFAGAAAVKVAATPGRYKLDKKSAWTVRVFNKAGTRWTESSAKLTLSLAGVPANVSRVRITWGDGAQQLVARSTSKVSRIFYSGGSPYRVSVSMENADGNSAAKAVGTFVVTLDTFAPTVKLTVPKSPTKASSWKTVRGTSSDKGAGVAKVVVSIWELRGTKLYYYNWSKKKWVRIGFDQNMPAAGEKALKPNSKGAWSTPVKGLAKGTMQVSIYSEDKSGYWSGWKDREQEIKK
jgi:5'-nucleotidase